MILKEKKNKKSTYKPKINQKLTQKNTKQYEALTHHWPEQVIAVNPITNSENLQVHGEIY